MSGFFVNTYSSNNGYKNFIFLKNYGENDIPRWPNRNGRAYLNPFVKFINGGEKWIFNFYGQINNTEEYYYSDIGKNRERLNNNQKEEFSNCSYEFMANRWKKGKTPTEAMFLFNWNFNRGIDNRFFTVCIESVKDTISNEIFSIGNYLKISIIIYNLSVDFYSYNEKYTEPEIISVNDEEMFLSTKKNNLIFSLQKDKD